LTARTKRVTNSCRYSSFRAENVSLKNCPKERLMI